MQEHGDDYNEAFAPVIKYTTLRVFFTIASVNSKVTHQLDFECAFAYAPVDEDINARSHPEMHTPAGMVCKLRESMYGLKQASRHWNFCSLKGSWGHKVSA